MLPETYQVIDVSKAGEIAETWAVVYIPTNENVSHHESRGQALQAVKRYRAADARRRVS